MLRKPVIPRRPFSFPSMPFTRRRCDNMKKIVLKRTAALLAAAVMLALCGCGIGSGNSGKDDSLQKVLDKGQLILGLDVGFPPMGFVDGSGEITGFDIDMAEEVCSRLGVKLVKQGINWDDKEDLLNGGAIDCIWNGMSITPARAEAMNLSEAYMKNELILVIRGDSDVKDMRELTGRTIGVQSGSSAQDAIEASSYYSKVSVVQFEDNLSLLESLANGGVDVALVDSTVAYYFISSSSEQFFILTDSLGEEEYAIGFRKNDRALRDRVQEIISEMKADGTLGKISKKWFGSDITTVR